MTDAGAAPSTPQSGGEGKLSLTANLLLLAGAIVLVAGIATLGGARSVHLWPVTDGRIVSSNVVRRVTERVHAASGKHHQQTRYLAELSYVYSVGGQERTGHRVSLADAAQLEESEAAKIAARYPAGAQVELHYDPEDPEQAVLVAELDASSYAPLGFAGLLLLAGLGMKLAARR